MDTNHVFNRKKTLVFSCPPTHKGHAKPSTLYARVNTALLNSCKKIRVTERCVGQTGWCVPIPHPHHLFLPHWPTFYCLHSPKTYPTMCRNTPYPSQSLMHTYLRTSFHSNVPVLTYYLSALTSLNYACPFYINNQLYHNHRIPQVSPSPGKLQQQHENMWSKPHTMRTPSPFKDIFQGANFYSYVQHFNCVKCSCKQIM